MAQPATGGMNERKHAQSQCHRGDLRCCVNRQDYVCDPIDEGDNREPIEIRIVPCCLRRESLKCPREARDHQGCQCPVHAVRKLLSFRELQDRDDDENCRQRGHDDIANPIHQVEYSVIERHVRQIHSHTYIIEVTSFQMAEVVSIASDTATSLKNGLRVAKFKIAPISARTAAIGMIVPARWFQRLSRTSTVAYCVPVL